MTSYGVTDTGFVTKTLQDVLDEIEQEQRTAFGPAINTQADSVLGQINGIFADKLSELWEVAEAIYRSRQPDSASGEALDNVAAITGAVRLPATSSAANVLLNLDDATTLTVGKVVSIGPNGEQWATIAVVSNATGENATVAAVINAVNTGPIAGNPGTIDTIKTPVSGWTAKAAITSLGIETFTLANGETLDIEVDQGVAQTVTFLTGDFADIANATAAEVAAVIDSALTGATAVDTIATNVRITSDLDGSGSALRVVGGTAFEALGFSKALFKGFNPDIPAQQINGTSEPYALVDGFTLTVQVDEGATQIVTFNTADFVSIGAATAKEVAKVITGDLTDAVAYVVGDKVQIESDTVGVNAEVEVTGGTANPILGFPTIAVSGESGAATAGRNEETDPEFRLRREELLRISGSATSEAIRSALLNTLDVAQAFLFVNDTDFVDINGLPPHSFESIVSGGTDDDVAQTIFDTKPVGIQTHRDPGPDGRTIGVVDSQGFSIDINFSRPTEIQMFVEVDISVNGDAFGGGDQVAGEVQVKDAIKAVGDLQQIGQDVIINQFLCAPFEVAGVVDVPIIRIEDIFPPTNTANIPVAARELATFQTSDIVVNVTVV